MKPTKPTFKIRWVITFVSQPFGRLIFGGQSFHSTFDSAEAANEALVNVINNNDAWVCEAHPDLQIMPVPCWPGTEGRAYGDPVCGVFSKLLTVSDAEALGAEYAAWQVRRPR